MIHGHLSRSYSTFLYNYFHTLEPRSGALHPCPSDICTTDVSFQCGRRRFVALTHVDSARIRAKTKPKMYNTFLVGLRNKTDLSVCSLHTDKSMDATLVVPRLSNSASIPHMKSRTNLLQTADHRAPLASIQTIFEWRCGGNPAMSRLCQELVGAQCIGFSRRLCKQLNTASPKWRNKKLRKRASQVRLVKRGRVLLNIGTQPREKRRRTNSLQMENVSKTKPRLIWGSVAG
jgi:hypothetical protein